MTSSTRWARLLVLPLIAAAVLVGAAPASAASPLTFVGVVSCEAAQNRWAIEWTVTNVTADPLEVTGILTPGGGVSGVSGIDVGDTLPPGEEVSARQVVYDYWNSAGTKIMTFGLVVAGTSAKVPASLPGRCGAAPRPVAEFASRCDGSVDVAVRLPASGTAVEVAISTGDSIHGRAMLEPGAPARTFTVPAGSGDITGTITGAAVTFAAATWRLPVDCLPPSPGPVAIFTRANYRYVDAYSLIASGVSDAELARTRFAIHRATSGTVILRQADSDRIVAVTDAASGRLAVISALVTDAARFTMTSYADGTFSLRSLLNGRYVSAESGGAAQLVANRTAVGPWEKFVQYELGDGPVPIRAMVNGRQVTSDSAGAKPLIASATAVGQREMFQLVDAGSGLIALRSMANNRYVAAESRGTKPLIANRTAIGPWETFRLIANADGTYSLQATINGRYVVAESNGTKPLIANRTAIGPWEKFAIPR